MSEEAGTNLQPSRCSNDGDTNDRPDWCHVNYRPGHCKVAACSTMSMAITRGNVNPGLAINRKRCGVLSFDACPDLGWECRGPGLVYHGYDKKDLLWVDRTTRCGCVFATYIRPIGWDWEDPSKGICNSVSENRWRMLSLLILRLEMSHSYFYFQPWCLLVVFKWQSIRTNIDSSAAGVFTA